MPQRYSILVGVLLLLAGGTGQAQAPEPPLAEIAERVQRIEESLDQGKTAAQVWWYSWIGVNAAATAVSLSLGATTDSTTTRVTQYTSALTSLVNLGGLLLFPMVPAYAAGRLRAMSAGTPEDSRKKLAAAEAYLRDSAENQAFGRSWIMHGINLLLNATAGLVVWKGFEQTIQREGNTPWREGLLAFAIGFAVGEVQILTQPTRAIDDWQAYQRKYRTHSGARGSASRVGFAVTPLPSKGWLASASWQF